jgi:hypothetical protein
MPDRLLLAVGIAALACTSFASALIILGYPRYGLPLAILGLLFAIPLAVASYFLPLKSSPSESR